MLGKDDSPFFVLNSDVICPFPFEKLLKFHLDHGCEGTILVTKVEDPSKYGVVVTSSGSTQVERFVEKPQQWVGNLINAGIYVLNPKALRRFEVGGWVGVWRGGWGSRIFERGYSRGGTCPSFSP